MNKTEIAETVEDIIREPVRKMTKWWLGRILREHSGYPPLVVEETVRRKLRRQALRALWSEFSDMKKEPPFD